MRTITLVLSILVCVGAVCTKANAQSWLPDRNYTEGPGIRLGDVELHPGVALRTGWDSNVFRSKGGSANPRVSSGLLAVTPHLHLSTLGKLRMAEGEDSAARSAALPKIAFSTGLSGTYFQYFKDEAQPRGVRIGVDADTIVKIMPHRPVSLDVGFGYQRSVQPFTERVVAGNYALNNIVPMVRLNMGSRSRVLTSHLGYVPNISYFDKKASGFDYLNRTNHLAQGGVAWKFLPHTALLFDTELGIQRYFNDPAAANNAVLLSDALRYQARLGINGALTKKVSLRLLAGYAMMSLDNRHLSSYENAVGEAVLGYKFGRANQFDLGYIGALVPSAIGGWMRTDRGFARMRSVMAGVFSLGLEAGAGYVSYGRALRPGLTPGTARALGMGDETERNDVRIDGAVRSEYRLTNWLALMADFTAFANLTDFEYERSTQTVTVPPYPAQFLTFQVYGGVRAHY